MAASLAACSGVRAPWSQPGPKHEQRQLVRVGESQRQWTGVAVGPRGRLFVCFPFWGNERPRPAVVEIRDGGRHAPFPRGAWNDTGGAPADRFVCVQALTVVGNTLWILDPANPRFEGVLVGGPKLVEVSLTDDTVRRVIRFGPDLVRADSYLNDVRIDERSNHAYLTDSGNGAIVVVDLDTGEGRRLLEDHPATQPENVELTIGGAVWRRPDGSVPRVAADGIALHPSGKWLYFQALTGRSLYRIETEHLRAGWLSDADIGARVEFVGRFGASDGLLFDAEGRLLLTSIEDGAVRAYDPRSGACWKLCEDARLRWPDSLALAPDGRVYVTTSQIHYGAEPPGPYELFLLDRQGRR